LIGRKLLSEYEIIRLLGSGGMGAVYEAKSDRSGEHVAIKWLNARPLAEEDPDLLRFEQEARIAGRLASSHIASVTAVGRDAETGVPFQVMELLQGEDVRSLITRVGPLRTEVALRIAAEACDGIAAAHAAGVVHRDIKPENLFLARGEDGLVVVKVLDFGIAKIRRTPENMGDVGALTAPAVSMTQSGQVLGTPLYMAPEQIDSPKQVDARCDVFSLGVTLYAMLTGAPPFAELKSIVELLYAITTQTPRPIGEVAPWVTPEAAIVVQKAMAFAREDRYQSMQELQSALLELLPNGFSLQTDVLVGVNEEERKVVFTHADSNPLAKTEHDTGSRGATTKRSMKAKSGSSSELEGRKRAALAAIVVLVVAIAAVVALLAR